MNEEEKTSVSGGDEGKVGDNSQYFIDTIENLKKNTVPKESYEKLKEENRKLINTIATGQQAEQQAVAKPTPEEDEKRIAELRKTIFGGGAKNLEFWKATLELRKNLLKKGEADPLLGVDGPQYHPIASDEASASRVADVVQQCIDYANGDPELFTQELQRRTADTGKFFW